MIHVETYSTQLIVSVRLGAQPSRSCHILQYDTDLGGGEMTQWFLVTCNLFAICLPMNYGQTVKFLYYV